MCASLIVVMIIERMRIIIAEHINISIGAPIGEHVDLTMTINRETTEIKPREEYEYMAIQKMRTIPQSIRRRIIYSAYASDNKPKSNKFTKADESSCGFF